MCPIAEARERECLLGNTVFYGPGARKNVLFLENDWGEALRLL